MFLGAKIKKTPSFKSNGFYIDLLSLVKINVDDVAVIANLDEVFAIQNDTELRNHYI